MEGLIFGILQYIGVSGVPPFYRLLNLKQVTSQEGRLKSDGSGVLQNENESVVSEAHESPGLYE